MHYLLKCLCSTAMAEIIRADAAPIMLPSSKKRPEGGWVFGWWVGVVVGWWRWW